MSVSTSGVELSSRSRVLRDAVELLSSMRFSISLLTVICIASVIGTVVKQNEPLNNYVNQFGPFWADVFATAGLFSVYSASWFLVILAFLVISTSLCIARNAPKIVADWRNFKEHVREQSLRAFHHKGEAVVAGDRDSHYARVAEMLQAQGWRARAQVREGGTMIAARKGASNKIGYLAAHGAIVLVCLGGLVDGDLIVRAQMALLGKTPFEGGGLITEVPDEHRLSQRNPTFRANLLVPEGQRAGVAIISQARGVVLQELPFDIELKRFIVEYYATGMPKLFASEIVVHDRASGEQIPHRVEVNKPAFHNGIAIYQSSFDDGGSKVSLQAVPLRAGITPFTVEGNIGGSTELVSSGPGGEEKHTLEFKTLRLINVENFGFQGTDASGTDVRRVDLVDQLHSRLGSGTQVVNRKELRNVGPSITYRIRDASGQAREFHNYMAPFELEGQSVFLAGLRETPQEPLRYLRIPADEQGRMDGWIRLRQALDRPDLLDKASRRYVMMATPVDKPEMAEQIYATTRRTLALFAGAEPPKPPAEGTVGKADAALTGGLQALAGFIEHNVPESDRARISEVLLRILNGSLFELLNLTREQAGLPRLQLGESTERFMAQAVTSLSDSFHYPVPYLFQLTDFTQVQASVFQVARAPGKTLVYIGCVALILGVFMMLYVRERRLWIWLQDDGEQAGRTRIVAALSSTRRTLQTDTEFERLKKSLLAQEAP